jgi:hypothetical protein
MASDAINDEERWRSLAAEARAAADTMNDPVARRLMLDIAAGYERLADRAKSRASEKTSK